MRFFKTRQYYMLDRINSLLKKKKDKIAPVRQKLMTEYFDLFDNLKGMVIGKLKTTSIDTSQKKQAKAGLIAITLKLCDVLRIFHSGNDTKELPASATHTFSKLNKATTANLAKMCRQVITDTKEVPDLKDYGMTVADLNEAEAYLKEFTAVKSAPALRRQEIANRNVNINQRIKECIALLENKIDPMMRIGTENNYELRRAYFSARKVLARAPGNIQDVERRYRKSRKKKVKKKA